MDLQISQESLLKYIGIQYDNYDCWEFVRLFYKNEFSINIPQDYYDSPRVLSKKEICQNKTKYLKIIEEKKEIFKEVSLPEVGDIYLMRSHGLPAHVGIYIGDNMIIHSQREIGVHVEKTKKIKNKIIGIYRYDKI